MKLFALIGYPLKHSFSKKYFTQKFESEGITDCKYELLELADINDFEKLVSNNPGLVGMNVTIPHKQNVLPFLDELDAASAGRIGAVNTIRFFENGKTKGYNTDYYGFKQSLELWLEACAIVPSTIKALVLGNGGAAKAIFAALSDLEIEYQVVSRQKTAETIAYTALEADILATHRLIVNTSPVGTFPQVEDCPAIPYQLITPQHLLYDLVYNPAETLFLKKGEAQGAKTHNGLAMLHLQADKAWEIWNE
jgi:shikimate dehydrogenase